MALEKPKGSGNSLISTEKLGKIPKTPHRPSSDLFWSKELADDWNDHHSPLKVIGAEKAQDSMPKVTDASAARSAPTTRAGIPAVEAKAEKLARKTFEKNKEALASSFLKLLDHEITRGELAKLSASTGGVRLIWTKSLNTTAGRANWKRETIRVAAASGGPQKHHKHHASIELASKVITTESRLLNVLAHEFCHLANFMVTGETRNPHGRSFKAWAAEVTSRFGDSHGIEVTTKHSYDIEFRFAWACEACGTKYQRHSRSIEPAKHRCGRCKGLLLQVKPVPRDKATPTAFRYIPGSGSGDGHAVRGDGMIMAATAGNKKEPSEYHTFMKKQMKIVRMENPGCKQQDIMRLVAEKWAKTKAAPADASDGACAASSKKEEERWKTVDEFGPTATATAGPRVSQLTGEVADLTLED